MKIVKIDAGTTLPQLAREISGDEANWKYIARLNKLDVFASNLPIGKEIQIPDIDDIRANFPDFDNLAAKIAEKSLQNIVGKNLYSQIQGAAEKYNKIRSFFYGGV